MPGSARMSIAISIHAPAKGATALRDGGLFMRRISIHAPAKGATVGENPTFCFLRISIHAPAKGATGVVAWIVNIAVFQSTLPRRERRDAEKGGTGK